MEVTAGATLRCKITTSLQPPKGVFQLTLTYELYFEEHMKEQEINIIDSALELIKPITHLSSDKEKADMILDVFMNIKKTDNSIRNRLDLFTLRSPEILKLIIEG